MEINHVGLGDYDALENRCNIRLQFLYKASMNHSGLSEFTKYILY